MNILKKIFGKKNGPKDEGQSNFVVATLNDKIMPIDRGEIYEDPLDELLRNKGVGEVTGGGTMQYQTGEIEFCDIEILLNSENINQEDIMWIINKLEELGAPKGSKLTIEKTGEVIEFGKLEGLALYLDGINLSDEVYKNSDSEALANEIFRLADIKSSIIRYWQSNTETGLYFYAESFEAINSAIADFVKSHPECENSRIEQVA